MGIKEVIYFCDCYLNMLDYDEAMEDIISEYYSKELKETVNEFKEECKAILSLPERDRELILNTIITGSKDLDITAEEMEDIIKEVYLKLP